MRRKIFHLANLSGLNRRFFGVSVIKLFLIVSLALLLLNTGPAMFALADPYVSVTVNPQNVIGVNKLSLGVHSSQPQYDCYQLKLAQAANIKMIRIFSADFEPCTYWDQSTNTGTFNWNQVDSVVSSILQIGAQPLITLGYVGYGGYILLPPGMQLTSNGLPDINSWAAYASQWVNHFKQTGKDVKYYEIFNEPWFYFSSSDWTKPPNYFKLQNYRDLFNAAENAMIAKNPNVLLGFDGSNRKFILDWWLANNGGSLGFVSFHKYDEGIIGDFTDSEMFSRAETFMINTDTYYYGVSDLQQVYFRARGQTIQVIDSESNFDSSYAGGSDPEIQQMGDAVWYAMKTRAGILSGLNYDIYFSYSSSVMYSAGSQTGGYGLGMINSDNYTPWYSYYVAKMIGSRLSVGDQLLDSSYSAQTVRSLAWIHGNELEILLIGDVTYAQTVQIQGLQGTANYEKIDGAISWQTPKEQTGSQDLSTSFSLNGYTVMLISIPTSQSNVGYWRFNEGTGNIAYDSSPNQNQGTIYNAGWTAGKNGVALSFNGQNSYVSIPSSNSLSGFKYGFSAEAWVMFNDVGRRQTLLDKWQSGQGGWFIDYNANNLEFFSSPDGSAYVQAATNFNPAQGTWYHIAVTWQPNQPPTFYVNGQVSQTAYYTGTVNSIYNNAGVPLLIGKCPYDSSRFFNGAMDELHLYNTALTAAQVMQDSGFTSQTSNSVLFADGFDSGTFNAWTGSSMTPNEVMYVTPSFAFQGTDSAVFTTMGNGGYDGFERAYIYKNIASQSELYARGYVYVMTSGITQNNARFYFVRFLSGGNSGNPIAFAGWRMINGVVQWELMLRNGNGWVSAYSTVSPNTQQWYSVELHWREDILGGGGDLYVNGQQVASISGVNTAALGNVDTMLFGIGEAYNCQHTAVYADSFVASTNYNGP